MARSTLNDLPWNRSTLGLLGGGIAAAALALTGSIPGILAGIGILGLWAVLPPVYHVAAVHLLLLIAPNSESLTTLAVVELGMIVILTGPLYRTTQSSHALIPYTILSVALLAIGAYAYTRLDVLWLTALVIAGTIATIAYALHRYAQFHRPHPEAE